MTLEEMQKLAKIISTADRGCPNCIGELINEAHREFPEFRLKLTNERWSRRRILSDGTPSDDECDVQSFPDVLVEPK